MNNKATRRQDLIYELLQNLMKCEEPQPLDWLLPVDKNRAEYGHSGFPQARQEIVEKLKDADFLRFFHDEYGEITGRRRVDLADIFCGRVRLMLSNRFTVAYNLLGLSISILRLYNNTDSISVIPYFGRAAGSLRCDIFVATPFNDIMDAVYRDTLSVVAKKLGFTIRRADDIFDDGTIIKQIWSLIFSCSVMIADCTGKNPNVFYEIGLAHTIGKKVILITQSSEDVPFDIRHLRYIKYEFTPCGMKALAVQLEKSISSILGRAGAA